MSDAVPSQVADCWMCKQGQRQCTASVCEPSLLESELRMALFPPSSAAVTCVQDPNDDVRAVAAEALIPISGPLASASPALLVQLRQQLWDMLLEVEDLSPSTGQPHREWLQLMAALFCISSHEVPHQGLQYPSQPHTWQGMQRMLSRTPPFANAVSVPRWHTSLQTACNRPYNLEVCHSTTLLLCLQAASCSC